MSRDSGLSRLFLLGVLGVLAVQSAALASPESEVHRAESGPWEAVFFYVLAGGALLFSFLLCVSKNVVRMAVWLFGTLGSIALLYFLLAANFLAAIQLIVYAGGTLVLLIFGVMLTSKAPWVRFDIKRGEMAAAAVVCGVIFATLLGMIVWTAWPAQSESAEGFTVAEIGKSLLTTYLVPFEVASVLLLVVMIGAAYLAKQES